MKRIKVFVLSALVALSSLIMGSAFAVGIGNDNPPGGGIQAQMQGQGQLQGQIQGQAQVTSVDVSNRISNDVRSNAAAFAGGGDAKSNSYSAGGDAKSGSYSAGGAAKSNSGGNTLSNGGNSLTVNAAPIPTQTQSTTKIEQSDYTVKNVPSVFSGNVYPTAPCMGSSTVGGAGVGFGISVGTSWKDDECGIRETSRSFSSLGLKDDALAVLCTSEYAKAAPACVAREPK